MYFYIKEVLVTRCVLGLTHIPPPLRPREALSRLFVTARGAGLGPAVAGGSVVGIDGSLSLRRASSIRRTFTSGAAGIKRNSRALLVKFQLVSSGTMEWVVSGRRGSGRGGRTVRLSQSTM